MTIIRASCDRCGDVKTSSDEVVVRTLEGEDHGWYRFKCANCGQLVIKEASDRIVLLLISSGVRREIWTLPTEMYSHPVDAPVINLDDVLSLHEELEESDWFDKLTEGE